jgi:hypothetical protein
VRYKIIPTKPEPKPERELPVKLTMSSEGGVYLNVDGWQIAKLTIRGTIVLMSGITEDNTTGIKTDSSGCIALED